jgi:GTP-binding protein
MSFDLEKYVKPAFAIVGRPNVGKSTLFNRITRTRDALVADTPGVTRDVRLGVGRIGPAAYLVVDTGGVEEGTAGLDELVGKRALAAALECEAILFMVDGRDGPTATDETLAAELRKSGKRVFLAVNKTEGRDGELAATEFSALGLGEVYPISAAHGLGVEDLILEITRDWTEPQPETENEEDGVRVAIVGRPNVGKSTLVNRMLGEDRMITFDQPGTTQDSVAIPFERRGKRYTLIDTAGLRRRARVSETVEKFSAIKTLQAIDGCNVVVLVLDAQASLAEQDLTVLGNVLDCGRSLVIAINKWDGLPTDQREEVKRQVDRRLNFADFAEIRYISALHGTGVGDLFGAIDAAWRSANVSVPTNVLTNMLIDAVESHQPPLVRGRRIKLRYAHFGAKNPPTIIIHGNQTEDVPDSYRRYLASFFRRALKLTGTPVRIEFRSGDNPFAGRRNTLTPRQVHKRRRLMRHHK